MKEKLKILIVEDENIEREGLKLYLENVLSNSLEFFEAISGNEAVEIFATEKPNIVLVDIKIPGMDGLTAAKKMKSLYPETNIIVVTGFNEFDFAKQAIKIEVVDYLLKPVDLKKLYKVILELIRKIRRQKLNDKNSIKFEKLFIENMPMLRQSSIRNIILGYETSKDEINKKSLTYNYKADDYTLFLFTPSNLGKLTKSDDEKTKQFFKLRILNIIENYLKKYDVSVCFEIFENLFLILIGNISFKDHFKIYGDSLKVAKDIQNKLNNEMGLEVDFGISNHSHDIFNLDVLFRETRLALEQRKYLGKNSISHITDLTNKKDINNRLPKKLEDDLIEYFEFNDIDYILNVNNKIFKYFMDSNVSFMSIRQKILELMFLLLKNLEYSEENYSIARVLDEFFEKVIKANSASEIETYFKEFLVELKEIISNILGERHRSIAEQARSYIIENLSMDLNLNNVAEVFKLSPCYFSYLFKKELGINFKEFLTLQRIGKSKILLKDIKRNVSEVAREIGYQDISYFSYAFRKAVGLSPTEYRDKKLNY